MVAFIHSIFSQTAPICMLQSVTVLYFCFMKYSCSGGTTCIGSKRATPGPTDSWHLWHWTSVSPHLITHSQWARHCGKDLEYISLKPLKVHHVLYSSVFLISPWGIFYLQKRLSGWSACYASPRIWLWIPSTQGKIPAWKEQRFGEVLWPASLVKIELQVQKDIPSQNIRWQETGHQCQPQIITHTHAQSSDPVHARMHTRLHLTCYRKNKDKTEKRKFSLESHVHTVLGPVYVQPMSPGEWGAQGNQGS